MNTNKILRHERNRIDLHLHSTLSDGSNSVSEVIELAYKEGMKAIALTDHNIFAITKQLLVGTGESCMEVIPGCEFSSTYYVPTRGKSMEVHVIGLFPGLDEVHPEDFEDIFAKIPQGKINYVRAILEKLETLDIYVSMDEVLETQKKTGYIGRHQIADVLIRKGYASTVDEAFDNYIGNYSPHYVSATKYVNYAPFDTVIQRIKERHGIPVLCHPFGYLFTLEEINSLIETFTDVAGDVGAMEVYYEEYLKNPKKMKFLREQQKKHKLLISAASDRHRVNQPFASSGDYSYYREMVRKLASEK